MCVDNLCFKTIAKYHLSFLSENCHLNAITALACYFNVMKTIRLQYSLDVKANTNSKSMDAYYVRNGFSENNLF